MSSLCLCLEAETIQKHKGEREQWWWRLVVGLSQPGIHVLLLDICSHSSIAVLCRE